MKKTKIITIITVAALLLTSLPATAAQQYGRYVSLNTFEGYNYFYDYAATLSRITNGVAHSGKAGYQINFSNGETLNFHANKVDISSAAKYYAQVYVKGEVENEMQKNSAIWVSASTDYENRVFLSPSSSADQNGWVRYSACVTQLPDQTKASIICYVGSAASFANVPTIYIDDISIQIAPYSMSAANITADANNPVDLKKVRVFGYDKDGNKELIEETGLMEWKVLSGDATVDKNGNLVCTNKEGTIAEIEVSFCGVKTTFFATFSGGISVSSPIKFSNGITSVTVKNSGTDEEKVSAVVVLYDNDGRLYDVKTVEQYVEAGRQTAIILPQINIPYNLKNATKKVVVTTAHSSKAYTLK